MWWRWREQEKCFPAIRSHFPRGQIGCTSWALGNGQINTVDTAVVGARGVVAVAGAGKVLPNYPDALPEGSDRLHFPGAREQKI